MCHFALYTHSIGKGHFTLFHNLVILHNNMGVTALRLARFGNKHRPYYRIVAIDSRKARQAKPIEYVSTPFLCIGVCLVTMNCLFSNSMHDSYILVSFVLLFRRLVRMILCLNRLMGRKNVD